MSGTDSRVPRPISLGGQVHRAPAELDDADLEGHARAQRRLLEDQGQGPAGERRGAVDPP